PLPYCIGHGLTDSVEEKRCICDEKGANQPGVGTGHVLDRADAYGRKREGLSGSQHLLHVAFRVAVAGMVSVTAAATDSIRR
ncbi:MAG TPA: hypothetical protein VKP68_09125, partial [Ramlibacter sp.]|nr:hypothetical protein [Ramlibacter sp.]